ERRRDEKARTVGKLRLRVVSSELGDQGSARRVEERRVVFLQQQTGNGSTPPRRVLEHDEAAGAGERRGLEPGLDSGGEYAQDGALRETTIVYVFWIEVPCAITIDIHAHFDGANQLRDVGDALPVLIAVEQDARVSDAGRVSDAPGSFRLRAVAVVEPVRPTGELAVGMVEVIGAPREREGEERTIRLDGHGAVWSEAIADLV